MSRTTKPLTAREITNAIIEPKKYKLYDGGGLFLLVKPNGSKLWRLKYRYANKEKEYAIGVYPIISLAQARKERTTLRELISNGIDPIKKKKDNKDALKVENIKKENSFYKISQLWLIDHKSQVSDDYHLRLNRAMNNYLYPYIKDIAIDEVTRIDIIEILNSLKDKGINETARRTKTILNQIFRYAVTYEYVNHNIIADIDIKSILGKKEVNNYPIIRDSDSLGKLLTKIDNYSGDYSVKMALKVLPYVFVRSSNIRHCEWVEIDFNNRVWVIPADKMKTKREFILPLSDSVINIFKEIYDNRISDKYVFSSNVNIDSPLSNNTLSTALRRMGYTKDELVPHSFRGIFSTIAYEYANREDGHSYTSEVIEALLSHKEPNKIKSAYNILFLHLIFTIILIQ